MLMKALWKTSSDPEYSVKEVNQIRKPIMKDHKFYNLWCQNYNWPFRLYYSFTWELSLLSRMNDSEEAWPWTDLQWHHTTACVAGIRPFKEQDWGSRETKGTVEKASPNWDLGKRWAVASRDHARNEALGLSMPKAIRRWDQRYHFYASLRSLNTSGMVGT